MSERKIILDVIGNYTYEGHNNIYSPTGQYLGGGLLYKMPEITETDIEEVYFGKEGCACGCMGKYYKEGQMIKKAIKLMKANEATGIGVQDKYILTMATTPTRHVTIYLKKASP